MPENHETYVEWLRTENRALVATARFNLAASVPTCPGWSVRDLLIHHGSFQAWITGMLLEHAQFPVAPRHVDLSDEVDVIDWYVPIGDQLVAALLEVGPDVAMWDVTGQHLSGAWARRQASETSVHRVDAQLANGTAGPIVHACDYIDEMLNLIRDLKDAQVVFVASDPQAEGGIGWNVAHLIVHVTASSEENAAVSSILARGIDYPFEPRLRV